MTNKIVFLASFIWLFVLGTVSFAEPNNIVRIAIITDRSAGQQTSPLVAILEAGLSQRTDVQLLERIKIAQILDEQKLSFSALVDRRNIIKAGQLLRANAFLMLGAEAEPNQVEKAGKLIRIRFVDTERGLRLLDMFEEVSEKEIEKGVERIINKVAAAIEKVKLLPEQAVFIGIVGIHRVQLEDKYQWLERVLPAMLSSSLNKENRIIMLERQDLKTLQDEKLLTAGSDSKFFSSTVLIDGYLQRRDSKGLVLRLSIRQGYTETEEIEVPVEPNEPKLAVDAATQMIIKQVLLSPPSVSWQPKEEADEFLYEGSLLTKHKRFKDALSPLETAHALVPQDVHYTGSVFINEWQARTDKAGLYSDVELAELVSLLVRQIKTAYDNNSISRQDVVITYGRPLGLNKSLYGHLDGYFAKPPSVSTEQIKSLNRQNRKLWLETIQKAQAPIPRDKSQLHYDTNCTLSWLCSDEPQEIIESLRKSISEYIMPTDSNGISDVSYNRTFYCRHLLTFSEIPVQSVQMLKDTHLKDQSEKMRELWEKYLEGLTSEGNPLVKYSAYLGLNLFYSPPNNENWDKSSQCCLKAIDVLLNELKSPNEPCNDYEKRYIRDMMNDSITGKANFNIFNWYPTRMKERLKMYEKIFNPLIEKGDAHNLASWDSEAILDTY